MWGDRWYNCLFGHARIQGGAKGALPPPSPQNIAPPNSEARAKRALAPPRGAKRALAPPPYKILDPPMLVTGFPIQRDIGSASLRKLTWKSTTFSISNPDLTKKAFKRTNRINGIQNEVTYEVTKIHM